MTIKNNDGTTSNVASTGAVNTATTLGAIGLGLGILNGGGNILGGNLLNNGSKYVTKEELDMSMKIAQKDSQIAILEARSETDAKLVDVFKASAAQDKELRGLITAAQMEQEHINAAQSAWNATAGAKMSSMATEIANQAQTLAEITTSVVPSRKVCDTGCCGCNN